jgi:hypothetical protein
MCYSGTGLNQWELSHGAGKAGNSSSGGSGSHSFDGGARRLDEYRLRAIDSLTGRCESLSPTALSVTETTHLRTVCTDR